MKNGRSYRGKAEKDQRAPAKMKKMTECQHKQEKEKKQLAEGHAKKQTSCKRQNKQQAVYAANYQCRISQLTKKRSKVQIHLTALAVLNTTDSFLHDSKTLTQGRVMMECSARSVSQKEPAGCQAEVVFQIDCDNCDAWVHTYCAFSSNTTSHRYVCDSYASSH